MSKTREEYRREQRELEQRRRMGRVHTDRETGKLLRFTKGVYKVLANGALEKVALLLLLLAVLSPMAGAQPAELRRDATNGYEIAGFEFFNSVPAAAPIDDGFPKAVDTNYFRASEIKVYSGLFPDASNNGATNFVFVCWQPLQPGNYRIEWGRYTPESVWGVQSIGEWWTGPGASLNPDRYLHVKTFCQDSTNACPNAASFGFNECYETNGCTPHLILWKAMDGRSQEFFRLRRD